MTLSDSEEESFAGVLHVSINLLASYEFLHINKPLKVLQNHQVRGVDTVNIDVGFFETYIKML